MNRLININAQEGDKVIFVGEDGYSLELAYAKKKLEIGKEYTVCYSICSEFQATLCLEEEVTSDFDTYMFIDADKKDKYMIAYLCEQHKDIGLIEEEAELILHEIKDFISEENLIYFIQEDLSVFRSADDALSWFNEEEELHKYDIDFTITEDMVGKEIVELILENKENCAKLINGIYLTWWL